MTGGGISDDGRNWYPARKAFLVPVRALAKLLRGKLRAAFEKRRPDLVRPEAAWSKPWVVHCTAWGDGEQAVLDYLARYVFRVAITNTAPTNETPLLVRMRPSQIWGVIWTGPKTAGRGNGMKWRVMVELTAGDGTVRTHEISTGGSNTAECSAATVGLTLADGKRTLAGLQQNLVQAQAEEYCRQRRVCSHCRSQRPLKDVRARRLASLFGTVQVRAPRFLPCPCAVTRRHTLNPVAEIMPDRCTPEYERVIAKMGSLLPYRRARTLLSEFLPLDVPAVETTRRGGP